MEVGNLYRNFIGIFNQGVPSRTLSHPQCRKKVCDYFDTLFRSDNQIL